MTIQFTPGPWIAAASPSSVVGWPVVRQGVGRSICSVSYLPKEVDGEVYAESEANAHLIAAAPELYEALVMIRNNWAGHAEQCQFVTTGYRGKCDCDWPKIAAQCDAALAKARGETAQPTAGD